MRHTIMLITVFAASLVASACDSKEATEKKDDSKAEAQGKAEEKVADEKKADVKAETKGEVKAADK